MFRGFGPVSRDTLLPGDWKLQELHTLFSIHCEGHFQHFLRRHFIIIHTTPVAASSFRFAEVVESHWNLTEITTPKLLKRRLFSVTQ